MDFSPVSFIEGLISVLEKLLEKIWPGLDTIKNLSPGSPVTDLTNAVTMVFILVTMMMFFIFIGSYLLISIRYIKNLNNIRKSLDAINRESSPFEIRKELGKNNELKNFSDSLIEQGGKLYLRGDPKTIL